MKGIKKDPIVKRPVRAEGEVPKTRALEAQQVGNVPEEDRYGKVEPAHVLALSEGSSINTIGKGIAAQMERFSQAVRDRAPEGLSTAEAASAFASGALERFLDEKGVDPADREGLALNFPSEHWDSDQLKDFAGLERGIEQAAAFVAQLAKDGGGSVELDVHFVPKGELKKRSGTERDTLEIPLAQGKSAGELRDDWDAGKFIPSTWWNPFDSGKRLRAVWKIAGNPVGPLRTRLRRRFARATGDLDKAFGAVPKDRPREGLEKLIERFVRSDLVDEYKSRVSSLDDDGARGLLDRWRQVSKSPQFQEDARAGALSACVNHVRDARRTIGIINVDTMDSIVVRDPVDPAVQKHTEGLDKVDPDSVNKVELKGTRMGFVNVSSVDVVTVMPNLARMIFGGASLERALEDAEFGGT